MVFPGNNLICKTRWTAFVKGLEYRIMMNILYTACTSSQYG